MLEDHVCSCIIDALIIFWLVILINLCFMFPNFEASKQKIVSNGKYSDVSNDDVSKLALKFKEGEVTRNDIEDISDGGIIWSAILAFLDQHHILNVIANKNQIESTINTFPSHVQRVLGALFSSAEILIDNNPSSSKSISLSLCLAIFGNANENVFLAIASDYKSLFPYSFMFCRRVGKSPNISQSLWAEAFPKQNSSSVNHHHITDNNNSTSDSSDIIRDLGSTFGSQSLDNDVDVSDEGEDSDNTDYIPIKTKTKKKLTRMSVTKQRKSLTISDDKAYDDPLTIDDGDDDLIKKQLMNHYSDDSDQDRRDFNEVSLMRLHSSDHYNKESDENFIDDYTILIDDNAPVESDDILIDDSLEFSHSPIGNGGEYFIDRKTMDENNQLNKNNKNFRIETRVNDILIESAQEESKQTHTNQGGLSESKFTKDKNKNGNNNKITGNHDNLSKTTQENDRPIGSKNRLEQVVSTVARHEGEDNVLLQTTNARNFSPLSVDEGDDVEDEVVTYADDIDILMKSLEDSDTGKAKESQRNTVAILREKKTISDSSFNSKGKEYSGRVLSDPSVNDSSKRKEHIITSTSNTSQLDHIAKQNRVTVASKLPQIQIREIVDSDEGLIPHDAPIPPQSDNNNMDADRDIATGAQRKIGVVMDSSATSWASQQNHQIINNDVDMHRQILPVSHPPMDTYLDATLGPPIDSDASYPLSLSSMLLRESPKPADHSNLNSFRPHIPRMPSDVTDYDATNNTYNNHVNNTNKMQTNNDLSVEQARDVHMLLTMSDDRFDENHHKNTENEILNSKVSQSVKSDWKNSIKLRNRDLNVTDDGGSIFQSRKQQPMQYDQSHFHYPLLKELRENLFQSMAHELPEQFLFPSYSEFSNASGVILEGWLEKQSSLGVWQKVN